MRRYGFIAGSKVYMYSKKLEVSEGQITGQWATLTDFQQQVVSGKGAVIQGLEKIVIIDNAIFGQRDGFIDESTIDQKVSEIVFIQSLLREHHERNGSTHGGVHLIVYTCNLHLYNSLTSYINRDQIGSYEGTSVILNNNNTYTLKGLQQIFEQPVKPISSAITPGSDTKYIKEQQEIQQKQLEEHRRIYKMLGAKEELENQAREIQNKLSLINKQIEQMVLQSKSDSLAGIDAELDDDLLTDVQHELSSFL